jgi:hypothetical protein
MSKLGTSVPMLLGTSVPMIFQNMGTSVPMGS